MHVKIKMKQTQNPMYNVSFGFPKYVHMYGLCTNHAIIKTNQAKLYSIDVCSFLFPEYDPTFRIIHCILTLMEEVALLFLNP